MNPKLITFTLFSLLSFSSFSADYETPEQARHHEHEVDEELDARYSRHHGTENLAPRFSGLANEAMDVLRTASDKVNTTDSFVYSHNVAGLTDSERNEYKTLVNQERAVLKKYLLLRDELLDLVFHAKRAGANVASYETRLTDLIADAKRLDKKIEDRPY